MPHHGSGGGRNRRAGRPGRRRAARLRRVLHDDAPTPAEPELAQRERGRWRSVAAAGATLTTLTRLRREEGRRELGRNFERERAVVHLEASSLSGPSIHPWIHVTPPAGPSALPCRRSPMSTCPRSRHGHARVRRLRGRCPIPCHHRALCTVANPRWCHTRMPDVGRSRSSRCPA